MLSIDVFFSAVKLNVHIGVNRDKNSFVFGLAPLQSHNHLFIDPAKCISVKAYDGRMLRSVNLRRTKLERGFQRTAIVVKDED